MSRTVRVLGAALAMVVALVAVVASVGAVSASRAPQAEAHGVPSLAGRLDDLPPAVSDAIGARDRAFRALPISSGWRLAAAGITANLRHSSVQIVAPGGAVSISLLGMGTAKLVATGNRVGYRYRDLTSWYAAGPSGLDQGFTVGAAADRPQLKPLTLAMTLRGSLVPRLSRERDALSLSTESGRVVLRYADLSVTDARGTRLHSWLMLSRGRLAIRVDASTASFPLHIDPLIQTAQLTASDANEGVRSVAVSGNTVVAGVPTATADGHTEQGAVFVFNEPPGGWEGTLENPVELTASDGKADDQLGSSVAISGQTVVASGGGSVYVWTEPTDGWANATESAKLVTTAGTTLAATVAISGQTVVDGGGNDSNPNTGPPPVYLFAEPAAGWSGTLHETAKLTASDGTYGGYGGFPFAVAISGQTVVASDPTEKIGSNQGQGAVYVFSEPASGWASETQTAKLTRSTGSAADALGTSVAISGQTVVAGSLQDGISVFTEPAEGWTNETESADLVPTSGSGSLGAGVAVSGPTVVATGANGYPGGTAGVFTEPAGGWSGTIQQSATLTASASGGGALGPVAIDGATIVAANGTLGFVFTEPPGGWSNQNEAARLSGPGTPYGPNFTEVAVSGGTVVTADPAFGEFVNPGPAYVFREPHGGWSSETQAAKLVASDGAVLQSVAIAGSTIVAGGADSLGGPTSAYVFSQPTSGWSGTIHEAAKLTASDGAVIGSTVAIVGNTVFAAGPNAVYVFVEPSGGWSGTVHEAAKLTPPDGTPLSGAIAASGQTVVATSANTANANRAYVFTKPPGGWEGTVHQAAELVSAGTAYGGLGRSVAVSGSTVAVADGGTLSAVYVFSEPSHRWSGVVHQAAVLTYATGAYPIGASVAVSGNTVAALDNQLPGEKQCPCLGTVYVKSEPPGGWAGTIPFAQAPEVDVSGALDTEVALQGADVFAAALDRVDVFDYRGPPGASDLRLRGLARGNPRLSFTVQSGTNAPLLASISVQLPGGLRFSKRAGAVRHGVTLRGARGYSVEVVRGRLLVKLRKPVSSVSVSIGSRAMTEGALLIRKVAGRIRYDRVHKHHKKQHLRLAVTIRIADATRVTTSLRLTTTVV